MDTDALAQILRLLGKTIYGFSPIASIDFCSSDYNSSMKIKERKCVRKLICVGKHLNFNVHFMLISLPPRTSRLDGPRAENSCNTSTPLNNTSCSHPDESMYI